jgi:hypothetical protein
MQEGGKTGSCGKLRREDLRNFYILGYDNLWECGGLGIREKGV